MKTKYLQRMEITDRVCIITGGGGLIGLKHAEAVVEGGGIPVLLDIVGGGMERNACKLKEEYGDDTRCECIITDITSREKLCEVRDMLMEKYGHIDVLINNAANNPKVEGNSINMGSIRFENFPLSMWIDDISVGLTGALICSQVFGEKMADNREGVILNISSDLGIIAPDQRIYRKDGMPDEEQSVKPVTYSVIKHGLIGLTKYLATYWADKGIRANSLCPGGVYNGQDESFMEKLTNLIPMGRMADKDEYKATVLYLLSDASSYMTGATMIVDGGRTCW